MHWQTLKDGEKELRLLAWQHRIRDGEYANVVSMYECRDYTELFRSTETKAPYGGFSKLF